MAPSPGLADHPEGRMGSRLSGIYCALNEAGHVVSIVNPAQIRDFARTKLGRNNTDGVDAAHIREYCDPASNRGLPCNRRLDVAQQPIAIAGSKGLPVFRTRSTAPAACASQPRQFVWV